MVTPISGIALFDGARRPSRQKPSRGHQSQQPCSKSGKSRGGTVSHSRLHCSPLSTGRAEFTLSFPKSSPSMPQAAPIPSALCHSVVPLVAYFDRTDREHTHSSSAGWIGRNSTCFFSLRAKIFSPASAKSATLAPRAPQIDET